MKGGDEDSTILCSFFWKVPRMWNVLSLFLSFSKSCPATNSIDSLLSQILCCSSKFSQAIFPDMF